MTEQYMTVTGRGGHDVKLKVHATRRVNIGGENMQFAITSPVNVRNAATSITHVASGRSVSNVTVDKRKKEAMRELIQLTMENLDERYATHYGETFLRDKLREAAETHDE